MWSTNYQERYAKPDSKSWRHSQVTIELHSLIQCSRSTLDFSVKLIWNAWLATSTGIMKWIMVRMHNSKMNEESLSVKLFPSTKNCSFPICYSISWIWNSQKKNIENFDCKDRKSFFHQKSVFFSILSLLLKVFQI